MIPIVYFEHTVCNVFMIQIVYSENTISNPIARTDFFFLWISCMVRMRGRPFSSLPLSCHAPVLDVVGCKETE